MKGRPAPGATGRPVPGSIEITVTPCRVSRPLPVEIDAASGADPPPASWRVVISPPTSKTTPRESRSAAESRVAPSAMVTHPLGT